MSKNDFFANGGKALADALKGNKVIPFSEVKGFLYGAVSETFEHKRREVVGAMAFNKNLVENTHLLRRSKRMSENEHKEE